MVNDEQVRSLETPCIVVDSAVVKKNIARMQQVADSTGCALRPHIKTHKTPVVAGWQLDAGAAGITCAKVSEAEVMARGGADDIFLAYPQIGPARIARVVALNRLIKRLIVGVDSLPGAKILSEAATAAGETIEVRLEVDTGKGRTGVAIEDALSLARAISGLPSLALTGVYTFKSLTLGREPTRDIGAAAREEGEQLTAVASALRADGMNIVDISGGSTPTGVAAARAGMLTEFRPGTYVYNDEMMVRDGVAGREDVAAKIYVTVVSVSCDHAVIDAGTKTIPMDVSLNIPPYFFGSYAVIEGHDDLYISHMNEEHGMVKRTSPGGTGLEVGQVLALIPLHVCTAINMHNSVYFYEDGALARVPVAARGMLL